MKYAFPVERGSLVRGIPTSYAAPPMSSEFVPDSGPPPGVARRRRHHSRVQVHPAQPERSKAARMDPKLSKCSPGSTRSVMAGRANASSLKRNSPRVSLNDRRQTPESQSRRHRGSCAPLGAAAAEIRLRRRLCYRTPDHRSGQRAGARHARRGCNRRPGFVWGIFSPGRTAP